MDSLVFFVRKERIVDPSLAVFETSFFSSSLLFNGGESPAGDYMGISLWTSWATCTRRCSFLPRRFYWGREPQPKERICRALLQSLSLSRSERAIDGKTISQRDVYIYNNIKQMKGKKDRWRGRKDIKNKKKRKAKTCWHSPLSTNRILWHQFAGPWDNPQVRPRNDPPPSVPF